MVKPGKQFSSMLVNAVAMKMNEAVKYNHLALN